jgi:phage-related protein
VLQENTREKSHSNLSHVFDTVYGNKYIDITAAEPKPIVWVGSSRRDLKTFPKEVRSDFGQALYAAQTGETDPAAKPLKGFGGAKVMEIIDRYDTNTYRAVYAVQFATVIYVLHAFQKKSKSGIATPQKDIDLIRRRLAEAQRLNRQRSN